MNQPNLLLIQADQVAGPALPYAGNADLLFDLDSDPDDLANQKRRRLIALALLKGRITPWDYQPPVDASQQYLRNTRPLWELYRQARFPAVEPPPPRRVVARFRPPDP